MVQYFEENPKEREIIVKDIYEMSTKLRKSAQYMAGDVPSYLLEESKEPNFEQKYVRIVK